MGNAWLGRVREQDGTRWRIELTPWYTGSLSTSGYEVLPCALRAG
jgi:hypothetical protein